MPYSYDVIFSYKRDPESGAWHQRVKDKLEHWLKMELNTSRIIIFFDTEDIKSGQRWRSKLSVALQSSKYLVCIWSPVYFKSKWCVSEWTTFEERGRATNRDLVIPARYHDGDHYPQQAKDRRAPDFSEYASTIPSFWDSPLAVEFEMQYLRPFARDVADMIRFAPEFDPTFPLVEAPDDLIVDEEILIGRPRDA
jgi:hypothetical protein